MHVEVNACRKLSMASKGEGGRALMRSFLRRAPDDWLVKDLASRLLNSVKNDGTELLAGLLD